LALRHARLLTLSLLELDAGLNQRTAPSGFAGDDRDFVDRAREIATAASR